MKLFTVLLSVTLYNCVSEALKCYDCIEDDQCSKDLDELRHTCGEEQKYCVSGSKYEYDVVIKFRECIYAANDDDMNEYCQDIIADEGECDWCQENYCNLKTTWKE